MTIDPRALRDAFGAFPTGVTVVATRDQAGHPIGFTANSFTSVSLDPPMLLVCLAKTSRNFEVMTGTSHFAVNILSETQKDVSNTFARPVEDRFAAVEWESGPDGCPVFANVAAWFECSMDRVIDAGDHVILLGQVTTFANHERNGLGYSRGGYFAPMLAGKAVSAAADGNLRIGAVIERNGQVLLMGSESVSLPSCDVGDEDATDALCKHLEQITGLPPSLGFLYSVYDDKRDGHQHIVYRAYLGDGEPRDGRFLDPAAAAVMAADKPTADILTRFALESSIGNFGVYFGDETAGKVHPIPVKVGKP